MNKSTIFKGAAIGILAAFIGPEISKRVAKEGESPSTFIKLGASAGTGIGALWLANVLTRSKTG